MKNICVGEDSNLIAHSEDDTITITE